MAVLFESQESSSPIITKAVSNGLQGKSVDAYSFSKFQKAALRLVGKFPKAVAEWIIPRVNTATVVKNEDVVQLKTSQLVSQRLNDYPRQSEKFASIIVGVGMGGATSHLALSLGGPFLPQAFVLTLKGGTMSGDVEEYFNRSHAIAEQVTRNNPDLMTIQHYDPVHDGWLVKRVNHLRLKLIDLPQEYKTYIQENLVPGGEVVYLEGEAQWKRSRVGERNVFQVGGWGDISDTEFLEGSKRLEKFSQKEGLKTNYWKLKNYSIEEGPESEWGSEAGLGEALEAFCKKEGYKFTRISFTDPNDFSRLAFHAKLEQLHRSGLNPEGVIIETFSQFEANLVNQSKLLPLWLIFNTEDSLRFLDEMKKKFPLGLPIFFSGLATFSNTPDIVAYEQWENALKDFKMINIGARKSHYPGDALALLDWKKELFRWAREHKVSQTARLTGNDLKALAAKRN